jgi:hypothetical protein
VPKFKFEIFSRLRYNYSLQQGITMTALDQIAKPLVVMPAYGRTYKSREEVIEAWKSGKDFKVVNGPYCSVRDVAKLGCSSVWIDLVTSMIRVE